MSIKAKDNIIALRSKEMIVEALISLMKDKQYQSITIKEIMEKADLVRRTFYGNFDSKEDIIRYYFDGKLEDYVHRLKSYTELSPYRMAYEFFRFFKKRNNLIKVMKTNNLMPLLLEYLEHYMKELESALYQPHRNHMDDDTKEYFAKFMSAGLLSMLDFWSESEMKQSVDDITAIFLKLTFSVYSNSNE